jgi:hypothetical protein
MEECLVCFDETNQFQLFTCGHKVCVYCYPRLRSSKCPVCNQPIVIEPEPEPESSVLIQTGCFLMVSVILGVCVYSYIR